MIREAINVLVIAATTKPRRRVVIVYDGKAWHVRALRAIEHDLDRDEKVYHCDRAIANDCTTLADAVLALDKATTRRRR